jgi:hypothetical protein
MKMEKQMDLKTQAQKELERLEHEKAAREAELVYKPFYKLGEGTHVLTFADSEIRDNTLYAGRKLFRVSDRSGVEYDLSVSQNSPLYRALVSMLAQGKTKASITRIGTGRTDTRYSVSEV